MSLRNGTSCDALRYNPTVEQAAEILNQLTADYIDHKATQVPIKDPVPGLQDLGYNAKKAAILQGADASDAIAIKAALLQGFDAFADCTYTEFGLNIIRNERKGLILAMLVLAGE